MTHTDSTLIRCNLNGELTIERRIATALGNERERERMIAVKAHESFVRAVLNTALTWTTGSTPSENFRRKLVTL